MDTKFDKVNLELLDILVRDGRESFTGISKQIQFSDTGIRKRLSSLSEKGILKVQGNICLEALNFKTCIILLEVKNQTIIDKITEIYECCPYVFMMMELMGSFNLLLGFYGHDIDDLDKKIKTCGPSNVEGVLYSKLLIISSINAPKFLPLRSLYTKDTEEKKIDKCCANCVFNKDSD